ncbi:S8 family serine peptidase [Sediminitomix flava]|uniref:Putative secreted protein (Por secretion system target) n=1 Tax=Sediminitomix flava TaxID=379075 RepID=A0A315ZJM2_SEDFL|nr:S8 family serine peptidase [Sediminitomix flava]PWJ45028.1 putative secreted protein (Por secretion system target) [Sediminitomix flava]
MLRNLPFFILLLLGSNIYAQDTLPKNQKALKELSLELNEQFEQNYQRALERVSNSEATEVVELTSGQKAILYGVDSGGRLLYLKSHNKQAAISSGIDKIQKGGELGYPLSGKGIHIGVWEVGDLLTTHQELRGKVEKKDGPSNIGMDNHSTHVTTTIIGRGINEAAKGMAYDGESVFYTAANDLSEMANEAAEGMLLSNHSYGTILGWDDGVWYGNTNISTEEDYLFGFYSNASANIDRIAYDAPYYLIVKSAGNDRGDGPRSSDQDPEVTVRIDGPYDCIGHQGVSKNILTVGAVNDVLNYNGPSSVSMSSFSSWGPADDGRIKPDIVANGVDLLSGFSNSEDAYASISGTSMSAPTATGALALLQELYQKKNDRFMKASTLKGLVIHTAKEAGGFDGPDYSFGWGLLSADQAAYVINVEDNNNHLILEDSLFDQKEFEIESDGKSPLVVTLSWTDVAGSPVTAAVDPIDLMLVNDLDIRLEGPDGTIHYPWVLDPSRPSLGATTGDNFRDNIEKIEIYTPLEGIYKLKVTHKEELVNGKQDFSLIISSSTFSTAERKKFLWRGESDSNFFDPANWELEDSDTNETFPTKDDIVVIDNTSLSSKINWSLDQDIEVYSLSVESENDSLILDLNGNSLNVFGVLNLSANSRVENGQVNFLEGDTFINTVSFESADLVGVDIQFSGDKEWEVSGLHKIDGLAVEKGFVRIAGDSLLVETLLIQEEGGISIPNLTLENLSQVSIEEGEMLNEFTGTHFNFGVGNLQLSWNGNAENVEKVKVEEGELFVNGQIKLDSLIINNSECTVNGNIESSFLSITNSTITFESSAFVKADELNLVASEESRVGFIGKDSDFPGEFLLNKKEKRCFDNIDVKDVKLSGISTINLQGSSTLEGETTGWLNYDNCDEALFVDFEVLYSTKGSLSSLINLSEGAAELYTWTIGEEVVSSVTELSDEEYVFQETGEVLVTLKAEGEGGEKSLSKYVNILEPTLDFPIIEALSSNMIYVITQAPSYQWIKNGIVLEGATSNRVSTTDFGTGNYQVLVKNKETRFLSDIYNVAITSLNTHRNHKYLNLYPNPVSGNTLVLEFEHSYLGILKWELYNVNGVALKTGSSKKQHQKFTGTINFDGVSKGFYFLELMFGNESITYRVVR